MKGHFYQRGKTWTYIIDLPPDLTTGKRRQKSKGGFRTKKLAQESCAEEITKLSKGTYVEDNNMTYGELLDIWLQDYAVNKLKVTVFDNNKVMIEKRIKPVLGKMKLKDITPIKIQRFYNSLIDEGYSSDYVKTIHSIVSKTLRQGFKWDMLETNIMEKVDPPRLKKKEMSVWSEEEWIHFLDVARGHYMYIVFSIAIYTGMRRGEVLGLRWSDIDFENKTISVQQTVTWTASEGIVFQDTKTSNSNRSVSIPKVLLDDLKERKRQVTQFMGEYGRDYQDHNLVCCYKDGNPIKPRLLLKHFSNFIDAAKVPKIRFHDLRHTHATFLIKIKVHPKVGAERLGQTTSMFMDRYAHVIESMQKEVAASIDNAISSGHKSVDK